MLQDLRYALRQLRKSPAFAIVAIVTLALGIGANTAIFTLLDQALLRELPVSHPEQLVRLQYVGSNTGRISSYGGDSHSYFSYPMYRDLRDKNQVFDGMLADIEIGVGVQWNNQSDLASGELVSGNYFDVLGVKPAMGRLFVPADDAAQNSNPVVVLSFNYWNSHFGGDPRVINQALYINGHPFTIIGVAAPNFHSAIAGYTPKIFVPMMTKPLVTPGWNDLENRRSSWLTLIARLKPGVSREQAEAAMTPLWRSIRATELVDIKDKTDLFAKHFVQESSLQLLDERRGFSPLREQIQTPLLIVMAMVGLVVLMACVNVSSLLLVRAAARVKEMSVRYAMGAGRWQIIRQLLMEGLLLGLLGGVLGLAIAPMVSAFLARRIVGDAATELPFSSHPDVRILLFNFGLAFLVSVLFSLAPALRFLSPDLVNSLKQQTTTGSGKHLHFRRISVGVQIGLSLLLLIGAGLFVQTLHNLKTLKVGFTTDHLVTFGIDPTLAGYEPKQALELQKHLLEALAAQPGVRSVAGTDDPMLTGDNEQSNISFANHGDKPDDDIHTEWSAITPSYFATMNIPLAAGRLFTEQDQEVKSKVAIISTNLARKYFGEPKNAIGQLMARGSGSDAKFDIEIVGVVGDTKHAQMRTEITPTVYRPYFQDGDRPQTGFMQYYVRTWQAPEAAETTIRHAVQQVDSKLVIDTMRTMDEQVADNISNDRLVAMLAVSFGILATILAAIGLYGVLAYVTAQRTREIGIRMALGAQRFAVMRLVLTDVLWLAGIAIVVTLPIAILLSRTVRSQLYNVSPADPVVLILGTLAVAVVAMLSALIPARRAATVEPMKALRTE
ncbi:MAG: ABC transporter permease [Candidatus Korobacteraceae bacterium]